jgi:hypothetical protein
MAIVREALSESLLDQLAIEASQDAIKDLQQKGISIYYLEHNQDVREDPDGSRYAIEYTPGSSGEYRILKPLPERG